MAPGHGRPLAALRAARHDRPRATPRAPDADVPPITPAGAPGQHRLRAVPAALDHARSVARHQRAPGHDRPRAASSDVVRPDRPRATLTAPGADVPLATTARVPGQHRLRAVAIATVALPAGPRRLRQESLPHNPANPRTLTYPLSYRDTAHNNATQSHHPNHHSRLRGNPRPPVATGGPQGGQPHQTTHQAHPAIQVPPHSRSCSTAATGFPLNHPARAPPAPCASLRRKPQSSRTNE